MATYPTLVNAASSSTAAGLKSGFQTIQHSLYGLVLGIGPGSSLAGGQVVVGPQGYPLRQEGGTVITATSADVIGNFGDYKLSSTAVSAVFSIAEPAPGARVRLTLAANPTTALKITTTGLTVTFGASSTSLAISLGSSLFFDQSAIELRGESTAAYRIVSYVNTNGSTILPSFTTG